MLYSSSLFASPLRSAAVEMEKKTRDQQSHPKNSAVWDCDSSLYDSFELKSFKQQLDSAIASRTLSMPRLTEPVTVASAPPRPGRKKPSKISKSIHKLLRSVFRVKPVAAAECRYAEHGSVCDGASTCARGLSTIQEEATGEKGVDVAGPGNDWAVRKTASDRFTGRVGIFR